MIDNYGRTIDYMRVSITDRCNLRCGYCMPEKPPQLNRDDMMGYDEILRVCGAAVKLGIRRFRVTGGEPFVRRGCVDFLRALKTLPGVDRVAVTTNGTLLAAHIRELAAMGIDGVNISLDTLEPGVYRRLTGRDMLANVLEAVSQAVEAGLRVRLNSVLLPGANDGEVLGLAALAEAMPVDVRFIERMPIGASPEQPLITGEQVLKVLLARYPGLRLIREEWSLGPARYYRSDELQGAIGIISPLSDCFCGQCNRVRLTSEGFLKLCLYHDDGISLRDLLRGGGDDQALLAAMIRALAQKPERHHFAGGGNGGIRAMSQIGG